MTEQFPNLKEVSDKRKQELETMRQAFKQLRMEQTGKNIFWTPELVKKEGALQVDQTISWQSKRTYLTRARLLAPSRLLRLRDHYAKNVLAISMRGAETWLLEKDDTHYIFKQDPRVDSYLYEKEALLRLNTAYGDTLDAHRFPILIDWDDDQQILITSYIPGETLDTTAIDRVSDRQKVTWVKGIVASLDRLHDQGVAHFDLAPRKCKLHDDYGVALIDYGSCGLGETAELVRIGHLRNTANPEGPRFHRAPELTNSWTVNGVLAERYGLARIVYWLVFKTVEPLIESARSTGYSIDTDTLQQLTTQLPHYNAARDAALLQILLANFSLSPTKRNYTGQDIVSCLEQRLHSVAVEKQQYDFSPLHVSTHYQAALASIKSEEHVLIDCDQTLFSLNIHNYTLATTDLAKNRQEAVDTYKKSGKTHHWKQQRKKLYRKQIDTELASELSINPGPLNDAALYAFGAQAGTHLYEDNLYTKEVFACLQEFAANRQRILIVSGSPRPIIEGVLDRLLSLLNLTIDVTVFGTEYHYDDGQPTVLIEGYATTKSAIARLIYERGGHITYGIGDGLLNDEFLNVVANHRGSAILINPAASHADQWRQLHRSLTLS